MFHSNFQPIELVGHGRPVSAMCFSHKPPVLMCSSASDYIIVWNIERCRSAVATGMYVSSKKDFGMCHII